MRFEWIYHGNVPQKLKSFLQNQGISKRLLAKIKFQGGEIAVNQTVQNVLYLLTNGDIVTVKIPDEVAHERLIAEEMSLDIIYEDEHFLVINKPAGVASIPSQYHPQG
ncbi:MAG: RluA family pseudouridine synthase, partial [Streptococcaceae bacterium]|nr:RluA family pseudouridine synthase [Streptococcaceae bacterium]